MVKIYAIHVVGCNWLNALKCEKMKDFIYFYKEEFILIGRYYYYKQFNDIN